MKILSLLIAILILNGCCWMSKRSCFPPCPPKEIIMVDKHCKLPKNLSLKMGRPVKEGCPKEHTCFDKKNKALLAKALSSYRTWIENAVIQCGKRPTNDASVTE
jgi:hypothetical protein